MPDDIVTRLIVQNGPEWVKTLSDAAVAEQRLIDVVSRASQLPPIQLATGLLSQIETLTRARNATEQFVMEVKMGGVDADEAAKAISRNTKALLENADAARRAKEHQAALAQASRSSVSAPLIGDLTRGQQETAREQGAFQRATPDIDRSKIIRQVQETFLQNELQKSLDIRAAVEERALQASIARERRRTEAVRAEFDKRVRLHSDEAASNLKFARQNPLIARGPTTGFDTSGTGGFAGTLDSITAATDRVTKSSREKNAAIEDQSQKEKQAGGSGITYLSTLSAIHAASFLATNRTFTLAGSLITLGAAFSKLGIGWQLVGVTAGGVLLAFNAFTTSIERLQQAALQVGGVLLTVGTIAATSFATATISSARLASGVEDAFAEIIAFGGPTRQQLGQLDDTVSNLSRRFGESAQSITQSSSAFIRAGGDVEAALKGASEAVVLLQVASRGELIPANAARSVSVVTNAFKEQQVEAVRAVDIIVGTAQKSALTFTEVTQAFQQAAPTAANLNIPLSDLAATIAVLANNGLRGQVAGSGLKQVLLDLSNPSKQAGEKLKELNISLFDTSGKVRPLGDVFADLQDKLGSTSTATNKLTDAQRAQALAAIFGSRANLAAAIIARTGKEDFDKMREAIEATSAVDIVNTLLAPTSAQMGILTKNVEEMARAFGGPLNVAFGSVIKSVNEFAQSVGRGGFERAGQALIAIATGQGFGPIIESLDELAESSPEVAGFLTQLLNAAITVRNAFVNQFIPAVQEAGAILQRAFATVNVAQGFDTITTAILGVVNAGSRLVLFLAQLISDLIVGNERGQELRRILGGLATTIGTTLVGAFVTLAVPMFFTIKLLEQIGTAAKNAIALTQAATSIANAPEDVKRLIGEYITLDNAIDKVGRRLEAAEDNFERGSRAARDFSSAGRSVPNDLREQNRQDENQVRTLQEQLDKLVELKKQRDAVSNTQQKFRISDFAEGELPEFFSNLAKQLREVEDIMGRRPENDPTESGFLPNPQQEAQIAKQIADIARDANREIDNLIEDSQQKHADLVQDTLKRIIDAEQQFTKQIDQINEDIITRKDETIQQIADTRADRAFNQVVSRFFEAADREHDASNSRRDLREQQALNNSERIIQRQLQDYQTFLGRRQSLDEQAFQRQQALEERAFSRGQQDAQRNLSQRQQREEEALQATLDAEARRREDARRLAEATPENRAQVQADINRATQDRRFQEGQQQQLKTLRQRHERENVTFQRSQEDEAFQFRIRQQINEFNFRIRLEEAFQVIKRNLEDREFGRQDIRDAGLLERRISRAEFEALRRQAIQTGQQNLQDQYQDSVITPRTFARIDREADKRKQTLGTNTILQLFQIIDRFEEQRQTQSEQRTRTARGIAQRAVERATTLSESLGATPSGLEQTIDRLNLRLTFTLGLLEESKQEAIDFLSLIGEGTIQDVRNITGSSQARPPVGPQLPRSIFTTPQNLNVAVPSGPLNFTLPADFTKQIAQGVAQGVQNIPRSPAISVGGNIYDPSDLLRLYQQYLLGQALQRR